MEEVEHSKVGWGWRVVVLGAFGGGGGGGDGGRGW